MPEQDRFENRRLHHSRTRTPDSLGEPWPWWAWLPFHIADLAEELVKRGRSSIKNHGDGPLFDDQLHVTRCDGPRRRTRWLSKGPHAAPFLISHYAGSDRRRNDRPVNTRRSSAARCRPGRASFQAVAAFDGKKPDGPTQTTGDPFPACPRANRIVKTPY